MPTEGTGPGGVRDIEGYDGAECLSGACALCNPEHPEHASAVAEFNSMLGIAERS